MLGMLLSDAGVQATLGSSGSGAGPTLYTKSPYGRWGPPSGQLVASVQWSSPQRQHVRYPVTACREPAAGQARDARPSAVLLQTYWSV